MFVILFLTLDILLNRQLIPGELLSPSETSRLWPSMEIIQTVVRVVQYSLCFKQGFSVKCECI